MAPSACGMAFRVKDAARAYKEAIERGAEPVESKTGVMELRIPAIKGIGGAFIYLVDRYATLEHPDALSIYDIDFAYLPGVEHFPVRRGFQVDRSPDAQCLWWPHGALGRPGISGSSTSAKSAISTSRASILVSPRKR
jgi:hypothetical protein